MRTQNEQTLDLTWQMFFTPYAKSVRLARIQVRKALAGWGYAGDRVDAAVLICSELATNAVRHAHRPGRLFQVRLTLRDGDLLIEVSDASRLRPRSVAAGLDDEHGRGLLIVAALADDTGHHDRDPLGKTVWARLALDSQPKRDAAASLCAE